MSQCVQKMFDKCLISTQTYITKFRICFWSVRVSKRGWYTMCVSNIEDCITDIVRTTYICNVKHLRHKILH